MFNFKAYFWGNDVYINEKYRYSSNEILTAYLNDRRVKYILDSDFEGLNFEQKKFKMQSFGYKSILDSHGNSIL